MRAHLKVTGVHVKDGAALGNLARNNDNRDAVATPKVEIEVLLDGIKGLDKQVAEATGQQKDYLKELEKELNNLQAAIADANDAVATLKVEFEALVNGIKARDKQVAEATEQQTEDHDEKKAHGAAGK